MPKSLKKSLKKFIHKEASEWIYKLPAVLGDKNGVVSAGAGLVFARLMNGQVIRVLNAIAPWIFDLQVIVGKSRLMPNWWQVVSIRQNYSTVAAQGSAIGYHHEQHEYPAGDTVFVRRDQFTPLLVLPAGGFNVRLYGDIIYKIGMAAPLRVLDADIDLSSHAVTAGAKYVLLEVSQNGSLNYIDGPLSDSAELLALTPLPVPTAGAFPICAFIFYDGQFEMRRDDFERTIIDLRQFTSDTGIDPATGALDTSAFNGELSAADDTIQKGFDTLDDHDHASNKLDQANTHENADTDTGPTAIHHTLGGSANQAAPGNHTHENGGEGSASHIHELTRWISDGGDTFDYPDYVESIEDVGINGLSEDPLLYSLSNDGSQLIFDNLVTAGFIITSSYILAQL